MTITYDSTKLVKPDDWSSKYMNWWSGKRYCQALGRVGVVKEGVLLGFNEFNCQNLSYNEYGFATCYDDLLKELKPEGWIWTSTYKSTCRAYAVYPDWNEVGGSYMADNVPTVVCK